MKAPTITHLVSSLQIGGAEKFVVNLAIQQKTTGVPVGVFSYGGEQDPLCSALTEAGVPVHHPTGDERSRWSQARLFSQSSILHIHSPAVIRALTAVFPLFQSSRVVYTIHGEIDPPQTLFKATHQIARLYLNSITAVSQAARESVRTRYGWNPASISVVPNGVHVPCSPLSSVHTGELRLGCVSRLIPLKNVPLVFEAISLLTTEEQSLIKVAVIGEGPERTVIERAATYVGATKTTFTGSISDEAEIYDHFDVLVNSSDTEGLPMSIIESMVYGRPAIATSVGAVPDAVIHGTTGWLYPARSATALAEILRQLLQNPELIREAGLAARAHAIEKYGIETVARRFEDIYGTGAG